MPTFNFLPQISVTSPENEKWIVLSAYSNQYSRTTDLHDEPYRRLSLSISGFFVCTADADRFWTWIRKQDLPEHGTLHRPKEISSSVYLGEYPWALSLREFHQRADFHDFYEQLPCTVRAATFDKTIELKYDAPETDSFTVRLPSLLFFDFQSLSWNGMAGYILAENGEKVLECPSLRADGPSASIVKRDFLNSFLESNDLVLFWTMYSERMILGRGFGDDKLGYAQKAACHRYAESKIRSAKQRTFRITPGERVEVK